jgi:hypothetical protein
MGHLTVDVIFVLGIACMCGSFNYLPEILLIGQRGMYFCAKLGSEAPHVTRKWLRGHMQKKKNI